MNNLKKMIIGIPILSALLLISYLLVAVPIFALITIGIALFLLSSLCIGDTVLVYYEYRKGLRRNEKKHVED